MQNTVESILNFSEIINGIRNIGEIIYFFVSFSIIRYILKIIMIIINIIITLPLLIIYLYGPSYGNIGFWKGQEFGDICHYLSNNQLDSKFWNENDFTKQKCEEMIMKRFFSLLIVVCFPLYIIFLKKLFFWSKNGSQLLYLKILKTKN